MYKLLLLTTLLLFTAALFGQTREILEKRYINETIYRVGGKYMKGSERLSFADLEAEFSKSDVGNDLYLMAKKNRNTSKIFSVIALGATVAVLSFASRGNWTGSYISLGGQFVSNIIGSNYSRLSTEQTDKAIWQRNKDVLFQ